jgi:hypothetical protein
MIDVTLGQASKVVAAIAAIGGAAIGMDVRYAPASAVSEIKADLRVDRIFRLVGEAQANGSPAWLCNALDEEFVALCTEQPEHYLCGVDARREMKAKAGCA